MHACVRACKLPSVCLARVTITPRAKIHTRDSDALCERMGVKYTRRLLPSLQLLSWCVGGRRLTGLEVLTSAKNEACSHTHTHATEVQERCTCSTARWSEVWASEKQRWTERKQSCCFFFVITALKAWYWFIKADVSAVHLANPFYQSC